MATERPADVATVEDAERLIAGWAEDAVADILGQMRVTTQLATDPDPA